MTVAASDLWDTIASAAARESPLWAETLLPEPQRDHAPVFSPLGEPRFALAVETIYEGYLAHYGRPRLFAPADADTALLLGDYLYAHGLVRIADAGHVGAVGDLAELISLCAQLRAAGAAGDDGAAWAATAAQLGRGTLDGARAALRDRGDAGELRALAVAASGAGAVEAALEGHRRRCRGGAPRPRLG